VLLIIIYLMLPIGVFCASAEALLSQETVLQDQLVGKTGYPRFLEVFDDRNHHRKEAHGAVYPTSAQNNRCAIYNIAREQQLSMVRDKGFNLGVSYYVQGNEEWSVVLQHGGFECKYKGSLALSMGVREHKGAKFLCFEQKNVGCVPFNIDGFEGVTNYFRCKEDGTCVMFVQKCGDCSVECRPVLYQQNIEIEFAFYKSDNQTTDQKSLKCLRYFFCSNVMRQTSKARGTLLPGASIAHKALSDSSRRGRRSSSLEIDVAGMDYVHFPKAKMEVWFHKIFHVGANDVCVRAKCDDEVFDVCVDQVGRLLTFSLRCDSYFNSAVATFWGGSTRPVGIETKRVDNRLYMDISQVGTLGIDFIDKSGMVFYRNSQKPDISDRRLSCRAIKSMRADAIERHSPFSFNYTKVPVMRLVNNNIVELLCQNIRERKIYMSVKFFLSTDGKKVSLRYESLRHKSLAVKALIYEEELDEVIDLKDVSANLSESNLSGQFSWQELTLKMRRNRQNETIALQCLYKGSLRCNVRLPVPGDANNYILFDTAHDELTHCYWGFGHLTEPYQPILHMAFLHNQEVPITHFDRQTLLNLSTDEFCREVSSIKMSFDVSKDALKWLFYDVSGFQHHVSLKPSFSRGGELLSPTHCIMQWVDHRLAISCVHKGSGHKQPLVLGRVYADIVHMDSRRGAAQPLYSMGLLQRSPGGKEFCAFWLVPAGVKVPTSAQEFARLQKMVVRKSAPTFAKDLK